MTSPRSSFPSDPADDSFVKGLAYLQDLTESTTDEYLPPTADERYLHTQFGALSEDSKTILKGVQEEAAQLRELLVITSQERRETSASIQELIQHISQITNERREMTSILTDRVAEEIAAEQRSRHAALLAEVKKR